jgi:hypothetical protein
VPPNEGDKTPFLVTWRALLLAIAILAILATVVLIALAGIE